MSAPQTQLVFDFDWSLINENSDTYIVNAFLPEGTELLREVHKEHGWTAAMDAAMAEVHKRGTNAEGELTQTSQLIVLIGYLVALKALHSIPFMPEVFDAVRLAASRGIEQHIVSDANAAFIKAINDVCLVFTLDGFELLTAFIASRYVKVLCLCDDQRSHDYG